MRSKLAFVKFSSQSGKGSEIQYREPSNTPRIDESYENGALNTLLDTKEQMTIKTAGRRAKYFFSRRVENEVQKHLNTNIEVLQEINPKMGRPA